jgi:hypothetical protein
MGPKERKEYIKAVKCLMSSPSKSDPVNVPGARVRQALLRIIHETIVDFVPISRPVTTTLWLSTLTKHRRSMEPVIS